MKFELAKGEVRNPGGVRVSREDDVVVNVVRGQVADETVPVCGVAIPLVIISKPFI